MTPYVSALLPTQYNKWPEAVGANLATSFAIAQYLLPFLVGEHMGDRDKYQAFGKKIIKCCKKHTLSTAT
jgi:hypothetical protein